MTHRLEPAEVLQTAQALTALHDLKERGGLTEEDYTDLKARLLSSEPPTAARGGGVEPAEGGRAASARPRGGAPQAEALVAAYAGDLHRLIVRALYERRSLSDEDARARMDAMVQALRRIGALSAADVTLLGQTIQVVCNRQLENLELLEKLTKINDEARLNGGTSDLGRTLTAIAQDSAQTLVLKRIAAPEDAATSKNAADKPEPGTRSPLRQAVRDDFWGALGLSAVFADFLGIGAVGQGIAVAGIAVAAGGVTIAGTLLPWSVIALMGGGVASGLRCAGWWRQG